VLAAAGPPSSVVCDSSQGTEPAELRSLPLDHREMFAVVNAWRTLKPGGRFRSLLAFTPQHRASYLQMLTIRCVAGRQMRNGLPGALLAIRRVADHQESCWPSGGLLAIRRVAGHQESCWPSGGLLAIRRVAGHQEGRWPSGARLAVRRAAGHQVAAVAPARRPVPHKRFGVLPP